MAQERLSTLVTWVVGKITGNSIETLEVTPEQRREALQAAQKIEADKYVQTLRNLDEELRNH